jgi:polyhydroxyalkanoate synthesis repressor PhaR
MAILIKRYANRKLYNTDTSRYITLKGIAELLDGGDEVRVIDNETGEDITSVALSQILVDSKRTNTSPPDNLLSQIFVRGGDVLYEALRRGVDDATDNIGEFQDRMRRMMKGDEQVGDPGDGESKEPRHGLGEWLEKASPDLEHLVQRAVERVFRMLDLPRRTDVETLNRNLERVASAVETLEKAFAERESERGERREREEAHPPS